MKNTALVLAALFIAVQCAYATSTATRILPESAYPGTTFTVTILLDLGDNVIASGVIENYYPSDWEVYDIQTSAGIGIQKANPTRIEWLVFTGSNLSDQWISYKIAVPGNASGIALFDGTLIVAEDGTVKTSVIQGDTQVSIIPLPPAPEFSSKEMILLILFIPFLAYALVKQG